MPAAVASDVADATTPTLERATRAGPYGADAGGTVAASAPARRGSAGTAKARTAREAAASRARIARQPTAARP